MPQCFATQALIRTALGARLDEQTICLYSEYAVGALASSIALAVSLRVSIELAIKAHDCRCIAYPSVLTRALNATDAPCQRLPYLHRRISSESLQVERLSFIISNAIVGTELMMAPILKQANAAFKTCCSSNSVQAGGSEQVLCDGAVER